MGLNSTAYRVSKEYEVDGWEKRTLKKHTRKEQPEKRYKPREIRLWKLREKGFARENHD